MKPTMDTSVHYWLKYKLKYSLWRKIWKYPGKVKMYIYIYPALVLLIIYLANSKIHKFKNLQRFVYKLHKFTRLTSFLQGTGKHFFSCSIYHLSSCSFSRVDIHTPKAAYDPKLNNQRITFHDSSNWLRERLMNESYPNRVISITFAWGNRRECPSFLLVSWDKALSLKLLAAILPS